MDLRIGNDFDVVWSIYRDGEPFDLSEVSLTLYLKNIYGKKTITDFSVEDNKVKWTFFGKDQKQTGKYTLILVGNEDEEGMFTTDAEDFVRLVSRSSQVDKEQESLDIQIETIELSSYLQYGSGDSIIVEGDVPSSALIKGTYAEASNEAATAFGGVESFLYHEGEDDERTIEVPNPTTASGLSAHAEGIGAISSGVGAHAEGNVAITNDYLNEDTGEYEQTIIVTEASGRGAHAEGLGTKSTKSGSHSEGIGTEVNANSGHGEGYYTKVHSGEGTHTEGMQTDGIGNGAHAEGYNTFAKGTAAHAEGRGGIATDYGAHVEGGYLKEGDVKLTIERLDDPDFFRYKITSPSSPNIIAGLGCNLRDGSHVIIERYEGVNELYLSKEVEDGTYVFSNVASGTSSHSEGALNVASGKAAHAEGLKNVASGPSSHVEGESNVSGGDCSHVEGYLNETDKTGVHLEGKNNSSDAIYAHIEGINNTTRGDYSHVEGVGLSAIVTLKSAATESTLYEIQEDKPEWLADNDRVWIEGFGELIIKKVYSGDSKWIKLPSVLGIGNKASITAVIYPVQGDRLTRANAIGSHVEGIGTETTNIGESAVGRFNASVPYSDTPEDPENYATLFSVGIGTSESDRKNGFEVKANGDVYIKGISNSLQKEITKKVNAEFGKGLSTNDFTDEAKGKLAGLLTIEPLSDAEVLKAAFEKYHFADRLNVPIPCFIKEESHDEAYQSVILIVEKYPHDGYKLNFINIGATSQFKLYDENGVEIEEDVYDQEWQWSPKCKLINGTCDSYLIPNNGYVIHLGKGELVIADDKLDASSDRPISNKGVANALTSTMYSAYFATYGEPSYERLQKEYANHKVCFCKKNKYIYALFSNDLTRNLFYFYCIIDNSVEIVVLDKNNNWTTTTTPLQEKLKDGQTIKTINGQSILGSGNLEILSETSVFEAVYGVTTYDEIVAERDAGKVVMCRYLGYETRLAFSYEGNVIFSASSGTTTAQLRCNSNNNWYYNTSNAAHSLSTLDNGNVQVTIAGKSAEVATPQYVESEIEKAINVPYVPEFTLRDIYNAKEDKLNFRVDTMSLFEAVQQKRTILIRESWDLPSLYVCSYLLEDLLYIRIFATGEIINCEFESPLDDELRWENIFITLLYGELMLATPSGDPMHYMYEAAGAEWNGTGADIEKQGVYGDTITHKAGYWYLNELGDITNEEMREIYRQSSLVDQRRLSRAYTGFTCRTNLPLVWDGKCLLSEGFDNLYVTNFCMRTQMEVFRMVSRDAGGNYPKWTEPASCFYQSQKLRKIIGEFSFATAPTRVAFECELLEEVRLTELKHNIAFNLCSNLSCASILYMIENEIATSAISIVLHADAYARAMADAEIQTALEAHPNVSLASA